MNITLADTHIADAALALVRRVTGSFPDRITSDQLAAGRFAVKYTGEQIDRITGKFRALDARPSATLLMLGEARYFSKVSDRLDQRDAEIARLER